MADLAKVKRNVAKMVSMNAPESDIDAYISQEGTTVDAIRDFKPSAINVGGIAKEAVKSAITPLIPAPLQGTPETKVSDIAKNPSVQQFAIGAGNQAAFGIPVPAINKAGGQVPEPKTIPEKAARATGNVTGFVAGGPAKLGQQVVKGIASKVPQIAGQGLVKSAARLGTESAVAGASTVENEKDIADVKGRAQRAAFYGATGAALPFVGRGVKEVVTGTGRWVAKNVGGITDATVDTIKRLGEKRVFDPAKAQAEYIGKDLVPRLKQRIADIVENNPPSAKFVFQKLGLPEDEINIIQNVGNNKRKLVSQIIRGNAGDSSAALERQKEIADMYFKQVLDEAPENTRIDIRNTYFRLRDKLQREGWLDKNGEQIIGADIPNKTRDYMIRILNDMKKGVRPTGSKMPIKDYIQAEQRGLITDNKGKVTIREYFSKLSEMESAVSGNPKFDRIVFDAQNALRRDAEKVVPGLKQANKIWSDSVNIQQLDKTFKKIGNENVPLEVYLEQRLNQLGDPKKFQNRQLWRKILGNNLFDDLDAHFANRDFEIVSSVPGSGGGFYPSKTGFVRSGVSGATKQYYKNVEPNIKKVPTAPPISGPAILSEVFTKRRK
jgi:hypothetical protein